MMAGAPERILVIKLGAFGDFVQALGPMRAIRRHHPHAHITLMTTAPFLALGQACGLFDGIFIDTRPKWNQPKKWMALRNILNGGQFMRVYDLQNNDRTALYFKLMTPKPEWVGAAKGASHRNASPERAAGHAFDGHRQTLARAGIADVPVDTLDWMTGGAAPFDLPHPYALVVPGAAPSRPLKKWPARYYAELCAALVRAGIHPVLIGSDHEKDIAQDILARCPQAVNLTGKTQMTDLPALARGAAFAVGNDTGPMHMIGPTGCKCLVLFSADSDPVKHRPLGTNVHTVFESDLGDLQPARVLEILSGMTTGLSTTP